MLRLGLRCLGGTRFTDLQLDYLRFFLHGESQLTYALYELLLNNTCQVQFRSSEGPGGPKLVVRSPQCLRAVGFGRDEGLVPYTPRSFLGYRLLHEYFSFPDKFLFVDLCEIDRAVQAGFGERMEVCIFLDRLPRLEQPVRPRPSCWVAPQSSTCSRRLPSPSGVSHAQTEYQVIPDVRRQNATEVYAVDTVTYTAPHLPEPLELHPSTPSGTCPKATHNPRRSGMPRVGLRKDQGMRGQRSISPW